MNKKYLAIAGLSLCSILLFAESQTADAALFSNPFSKSSIEPKNLVRGKWGTADVEYDDATRTLYISNGKITGFSSAQKNVSPDIQVTREAVRKIVIQDGVSISGNADYAFAGFFNIGHVGSGENPKEAFQGLDKLDTTGTTSMAHMFDGIRTYTGTFDVSNFDTSKVTDMSYMFHNTSALDILCGNFDTSRVTNMESMFEQSLARVNVANWNTSNVRHMNSIFRDGGKGSLDISGWDFGNVASLEYAFAGSLLEEIIVTKDGSKANTKNVKTMKGMFSGIQSLTSIPLDQFDTSNVKDMSYMFSYANLNQSTSAPIIDISNVDYSSVETVEGMFRYAKVSGVNFVPEDHIVDGNIHIQPGYLIMQNAKNFKSMFERSDIKNVTGIEYVSTYSATNTSQMFSNVNQDWLSRFIFRLNTSLSNNPTGTAKMYEDTRELEVVNIELVGMPPGGDQNLIAPRVLNGTDMFKNDTRIKRFHLTSNREAKWGYYLYIYENATGLPPAPKVGLYTGDWIVEYNLNRAVMEDSSGPVIYTPSGDAVSGIGYDIVWGRSLTSSAYSDVAVAFSRDYTDVAHLDKFVVDPTRPKSDYIKPNPDSGVQGTGSASFFINWATHFKFGKVSVDDFDTMLDVPVEPVELDGNLKNIAPFVQVTDLTGTGNPWTLTLKTSEFKTRSGDVLKGAYFKVGGVELIASDDQNVRGEYVPKLGLEHDDTIQFNNSNDTLNLIQTTPKNGFGTWTLSFSDNEGVYSKDSAVRFMMPLSGNRPKDGRYEADMVWVLSSVPY